MLAHGSGEEHGLGAFVGIGKLEHEAARRMPDGFEGCDRAEGGAKDTIEWGIRDHMEGEKEDNASYCDRNVRD